MNVDQILQLVGDGGTIAVLLIGSYFLYRMYISERDRNHALHEKTLDSMAAMAKTDEALQTSIEANTKVLETMVTKADKIFERQYNNDAKP